MTQTELAKECGVSQATVAMWEKGICFPKAEKIMTVAKALRCDCSLLLQLAEARQKGA